MLLLVVYRREPWGQHGKFGSTGKGIPRTKHKHGSVSTKCILELKYIVSINQNYNAELQTAGKLNVARGMKELPRHSPIASRPDF